MPDIEHFGPRKITQVATLEIKSIEVAQWARDETSKPELVVMTMTVEGIPEGQFIMRFKGAETLTVIFKALEDHGTEVFGALEMAKALANYEMSKGG